MIDDINDQLLNNKWLKDPLKLEFNNVLIYYKNELKEIEKKLQNHKLNLNLNTEFVYSEKQSKLINNYKKLINNNEKYIKNILGDDFKFIITDLNGEIFVEDEIFDSWLGENGLENQKFKNDCNNLASILNISKIKMSNVESSITFKIKN